MQVYKNENNKFSSANLSYFMFSIILFIFLNIFDFCFNKKILGFFNDILIGVIVSFIFYYIVVYFPNKKRESIIKKYYKKRIDSFKVESIEILLSTLNEGFYIDDNIKRENLLIVGNFRSFFKEKTSPTTERWDDVANGLEKNKEKVFEIIGQLKTLEEESRFILNKLEINDDRVYYFLKEVSKITHNYKEYNEDGDDLKSIMSLLWQIFAGWDWISGYSEKDIFQIIYDEL